MKNIVLALGVAAAMAAQTARAEEQPAASDFQFLFTLGVTSGGDKLAEIEYEHGSDRDIKAGGLLLFGAGFDYQFGNNWEIQSTINYQFDRADADNGDVEFERFPLDVLGFYRNGSHRFGGGITYHMNPKYSIDVDNGVSGDVDFDDALGLVVEYDYFFSQNVSLGVRYTDIEYDASDFNETIDGSHFGIIINALF
jgi:hypothetical protein